MPNFPKPEPKSCKSWAEAFSAAPAKRTEATAALGFVSLATDTDMN